MFLVIRENESLESETVESFEDYIEALDLLCDIVYGLKEGGDRVEPSVNGGFYAVNRQRFVFSKYYILEKEGASL